MNTEHREAIGEANRRRGGCQRCGNQHVRKVDGSQLDPETHWAGILYKVCNACGHEQVMRAGPRGSGRASKCLVAALVLLLGSAGAVQADERCWGRTEENKTFSQALCRGFRESTDWISFHADGLVVDILISERLLQAFQERPAAAAEICAELLAVYAKMHNGDYGRVIFHVADGQGGYPVVLGAYAEPHLYGKAETVLDWGN